MSESGHELRDNNEKIVKLMTELKKQRNEMNFLIEKQEKEKGRLQNEIEKLSFKLTLVGVLTKSLNQRIQARTNYDKTINEIEENYTNLVEESGKLLFSINKEYHQLEQIMDKKTGTGNEKSSKENDSNSNVSPEDDHSSSNSQKSATKNGSNNAKTTKDGDSTTDSNLKSAKTSSSLLEPVIPKKPSRVQDDEVQSFREAYGRQHTQEVPSRSPSHRSYVRKSNATT